MPKFIANGLIYLNGRTHRHGAEITLTDEQAKALGKKVVPMEVAKPATPLKEMTLKELKPLAKSAGVENYSKLDKMELVSVLEAVQPEVVETDDEPGSD